VHRRTFLAGATAGGAALSLGPTFWQAALASPARPGNGPYGPLQAPNANGLMLPEGFSSRIVGLSNTPVPGTTYPWHPFPDGAATFALPGGGWIFVSNSEVPLRGGASAIRFRKDGSIRSAYRILENTNVNCAGGPSPWGTWLSCEEVQTGQVWECDIRGNAPGVARPALGRFNHEAAAVDPERGHVYLTEDASDGLLYRFTPARRAELGRGELRAARWRGDGTVKWLPVPDPSAASQPTRQQVPGATRFRRGEGMWFDSGVVYFSTTSDHRVWAYECATKRLEVIYDGTVGDDLPLRSPDNLAVHARSGDLYVAEDRDNLEVVLITNPFTPTGTPARKRIAAPFLRIDGHESSELAGPVFDPKGRRLYVSSQRGSATRGPGLGVTYEITGPFRTVRRSA
jgi:uncharacterized protein